MESLVGWLDANLISILNGVARGLLLFTMAVGLSLIFGLADVLNLAHGAVFLLGAYMAFQFAGDGTGFVVAVLAAVVLGVLLGGGLTAALRPISGRGHLDQALLTLGIAFVLSDIASIVWGNDFRSVPPPAFLRGSTNIVGHAYPTYRLAVIVVGLAIAGAVYALFERTQLGAVVRAAVETAVRGIPGDYNSPDVSELRRVEAYEATTWSVAGVMLATGLAGLAIAGADRVTERRRRLASLWAVGAPSGVLRRSQLFQSLLPLAVGGPLAVVIGGLIGTAYLALGGIVGRFPWSQTLVLLAIALAAAVITAVISQVGLVRRPSPELFHRE